MNKTEPIITGVPVVEITGRIARNPELKTLSDGRKLMRLLIRTEKTIYRKGIRIVMNRWYMVMINPDRCLLMEFKNHKNAELSVVGWIRKKNYVDKSGVMRYVTEVEASEVMVVLRE